MFSKLRNNEVVSLRICKKISLALTKIYLVCHYWLGKSVKEVHVRSTDKGPMLAILVNETPVSCILDTGSTFTLIPFTLWQQLKINPNKLDSSIVYSVNSPSHKNPNAVLGSINLNLAIKTRDGDDQKFLILKPELKLEIILLGEDFY